MQTKNQNVSSEKIETMIEKMNLIVSQTEGFGQYNFSDKSSAEILARDFMVLGFCFHVLSKFKVDNIIMLSKILKELGKYGPVENDTADSILSLYGRWRKKYRLSLTRMMRIPAILAVARENGRNEQLLGAYHHVAGSMLYLLTNVVEANGRITNRERKILHRIHKLLFEVWPQTPANRLKQRLSLSKAERERSEVAAREAEFASSDFLLIQKKDELPIGPFQSEIAELLEEIQKQAKHIDLSRTGETFAYGTDIKIITEFVGSGSEFIDYQELRDGLIALKKCIGLPTVKMEILLLLKNISERRENIKYPPLSKFELNLAMLGNSGTGKRHVAAILTRLLFSFGLLNPELKSRQVAAIGKANRYDGEQPKMAPFNPTRPLHMIC